MTAHRLSHLQRRILAWLALVGALGVDKGNLSHSLANLEALVCMIRTAGGKAEAVDLTPAGRQQVVNKEQAL